MILDDPIQLFANELRRAAEAGIIEPNAMALATADANGHPSVRMVLLKEYDERGFTFYTNLESRKATELRTNPWASICLYWQPIGRQIRAEGPVKSVSDAEADQYFASRPRGRQIGAWASKQSQELASREALMDTVHATEARFEGMAVPRPPFWSGFRLVPLRMEFWIADEFRLHDRLVFERQDENGGWHSYRIFP